MNEQIMSTKKLNKIERMHSSPRSLELNDKLVSIMNSKWEMHI